MIRASPAHVLCAALDCFVDTLLAMTGLFNTSSLRAQRSNPERHKETAERISPPPPSPPPDQLLRHPVGHRRRRRPAHPAFGPDIGEPVGDLPDEYLDLKSEEHKSELQSLMLISYAVFCLQNKKS